MKRLLQTTQYRFIVKTWFSADFFTSSENHRFIKSLRLKPFRHDDTIFAFDTLKECRCLSTTTPRTTPTTPTPTPKNASPSNSNVASKPTSAIQHQMFTLNAGIKYKP